MSLANPHKMIFGGDDTRLLIDESPYQFLPSLAQIFSDTGALVLQQLHYIARHPYFEGERLPTQWKDELFFVQIPGFMWWDSIEGFLRHLTRRTFERKVSDLKETGVLVVENRVGHFRDQENYKWYAIDYGKLKGLEDDHRANFLACKEERERERAAVRTASDGTANWRPRTGEDTSRQIGEWCPSIDEKPSENQPSPPPKKSVSQGLRQNVASLPPSKPSDKLSHVACDKMADTACDKLSHVACDKMAAPSLYKRHRDISENTENTASLEMSPADAESEVESNLILSEETQSEMSSQPQRTPPANEIALPETALAPLPDPLPQPLADLAARFVETAADEYALKCDLELAARIVGRSPLAAMSDKSVLRLIGPDRAEAGLDKALFGETKQEMAADVPALRWLLLCWPGHRTEVEEWAARKNRPVKMAGAFVTKWNEKTQPPRDWMVAQMSSMRAEIRAAQVALEEERAKTVWDGLKEPQRAALMAEAQSRADAHGSGNYNRAKELFASERRALLLDDEFVVGLNEAAPIAEKSSVASEKSTAEIYQPKPSERGRLELYATKLSRRVNAGEFDLGGVEAVAKRDYPLDNGQLRFVVELVETIVEGLAMPEAA